MNDESVNAMMLCGKRVPGIGAAICGVALLGIALLGAAYAYGPVKGWYHRTFCAPPILNAPFIETFDSNRGESQRERLFSIYQARSGSYGLRRTVYSPEATPIGQCLVVENGRITLIADTTRDKYGTRKFHVEHPDSLVLGRLASGETWGFLRTNTQIYLKSYSGSKLVHCF